jgi:hypothetical protein
VLLEVLLLEAMEKGEVQKRVKSARDGYRDRRAKRVKLNSSAYRQRPITYEKLDRR